MKISAARTRAFDILLDVEREGAHSSTLLARTEPALEDRDRSLCHEIVLGTLRNQILLDGTIRELSSRPNSRLDVEVLVALRMGLYQLHFLDKIPDYAAVSDSVQLVVRAGKRSAKGLVNAVLRKALRKWPSPPVFESDAERLTFEYSHPRWLVDRWIGRFGIKGAEELLAHNNSAGKLSFRFTCRFDSFPDLEQRKIRDLIGSDDSISASELLEGSFIASGRSGLLSRLLSEYLIYFQDEASQIAALAALPEQPGSLLDLCAAPGSKTTLAARKFDPAGGLLVAGDVSPLRAGFLRTNCKSQGAGFVNVLRLDAEKPLPFCEEAFDSVFVDAPCTGTGTIAQNPEIRYRLQPDDLSRLPVKQLAILESASKVLKPGGKLVYSTCSLEPEENQSVARDFLSQNRRFRLEDTDVAERFRESEGFAVLLPQRDRTSGFFIATFRKQG